MNLLNIENLEINNENYKLNLTIKEKEIYPFFARDNYVLKEFFHYLSGINHSNNVFFNKKIAYDNKQYFNMRLYFNCEDYFFKTIYPHIVAETLLNKYGLTINQENFEKVINDLLIRLECDIKGECKFTPVGNNLINFAFISSIDKPFLIINNPTINLNDGKHINYIINSIKNLSKDKTIVLGVNNLEHFKNELDKLIIFSDYSRVVTVDTNKDRISVITGSPSIILDIVSEEKRLFFSTKNDIYHLAFVNDLDREQIKILNKSKCQIEKIDIYDIENYM